jgi:nitroreductase
MKSIVHDNFIKNSLKKFILFFDNINLFLQNNNLIWRWFNYIFDYSFFQEYTNVISGIFSYRNDEDNYFEYRRNIHRLEKGLISYPRKDFFASDYIRKTVSLFITLSEKHEKTEMIKWGGEVLNLYFNCIKNYPNEIEILKNSFYKIYRTEKKSNYLPYIPSFKNLINHDQLGDFFKNKKSVRYFNENHVSDKIIKKALNTASLAPSGCNRQTYEYYVFNKKYKFVQEVLNFSAGTKGWGKTVHNCIVLVAKLDAFNHKNSRHAGHVDGILSLSYFILALKSLGVESCLINWVDNPIVEKKLLKKIKAKINDKILITIAIGYPSENSQVAFSSRLESNYISNL